jgi:hypothetical protein
LLLPFAPFRNEVMCKRSIIFWRSAWDAACVGFGGACHANVVAASARKNDSLMNRGEGMRIILPFDYM